MFRMLPVFVAVRLMLPGCGGGAFAENWPRFRGPTGQGISSETGLPSEWSAQTNVAWRTAIPGDGWSSPIVWEDRVFVTTATEGGVRCHVICLDRDTGEIVWNVQVLEQIPARKEGKNSYASPTPVTDGSRVIAVFGDGSVAALDFSGRLLWTNRDVAFYSRHGLGASPILYGGLVIMPYDGSNRVDKPGSYPNNAPEERLGWQIPWDRAEIAALDVATGRRAWTGRRGMSRIAHVTPNILRCGGSDLLISCAGDVIQAFDPRSGNLLWTVPSQGEGVTPSFAMGDGMVFTSSGFENTTIRTVRVDAREDSTRAEVAWEQKKGAPTQPSLLYVSPYLYSLTDNGVAHCYDGKTGEPIWQGRIGGNFCASPVYADGKIYFLSEEGETTVIAAGPKFRVLARNPLGERCQASMAVSGGRFFIRTAGHLICIAGGATQEGTLSR